MDQEHNTNDVTTQESFPAQTESFTPATENAEPAPEKPKKKKSAKPIVIAVAAVAVIAALVVGVFFAVKEGRVKSDLKQLESALPSYEAHEMNYTEASEFVKSFINPEKDQRVIDSATEIQNKLGELREPTEAYYRGLDLLKQKEYYQAATQFKSVTAVSKNYESAQKNFADLKEQVKEELEKSANDSGTVKNYDKAISTLNSYAELYSEDVFGEKLKALKEEQTKYLAAKKAEEEKKKAEQEKQAREKAQSQLRISRCWVSGPDSAGGYELHINWTNKTSKTVKYLHFGVTFYDPVGEPISTWRIDKVEYCQDVGPFGPGGGRSGSNWYWGKYYDSIISYPELVYLKVEYTDGTSWTLNSNEIAAVQY